jgi:hypothetical protein
MATKNPRLNITMEPFEVTLLTKLAKQEDRSVSSLVKELLREALEVREDMVLSAIAAERDTDDLETVSHEEAWK